MPKYVRLLIAVATIGLLGTVSAMAAQPMRYTYETPEQKNARSAAYDRLLKNEHGVSTVSDAQGSNRATCLGAAPGLGSHRSTSMNRSLSVISAALWLSRGLRLNHKARRPGPCAHIEVRVGASKAVIRSYAGRGHWRRI